jgi:hypothetical protein
MLVGGDFNIIGWKGEKIMIILMLDELLFSTLTLRVLTWEI